MPRGPGACLPASSHDDGERRGAPWLPPLAAPGRGLSEGSRLLLPPPSPSAEPWQRRWALLERLRPISVRRTARCRSRRISPTVQVQRGTDQQTIGLSGVVTCSSPWGCPCCAARIYAERAGDVQKAVERWGADRCVMLTLTVRHGLGDDLKDTRSAVTRGWRALWGGNPGRRLKKKLGVRHVVRALEVTHGRNGWHPHIHALLLLDTAGGVPDEVVAELQARWVRSVSRVAGNATPDYEHGAVLTSLHGARYIAKLGLEIASIAEKRGHQPGARTPWAIAARAARGERRFVELWTHYTESMYGARQLTWSRDMRRELELGEERTDEECQAEPPGLHVATVPGEMWDRCSKIPGWVAELLRRARGSTPMQDVAQWLARARAGP